MNVSSQSEAPGQYPDESVTTAPTGTSLSDGDSRRDRFRRGFERFRGDADAYGDGETQDGEGSLELTVLLLREENARLKAERHRPPDVGTMIAQMRRIALEQGEEELSDEAWSLMSECLVMREELNQACIEIKAAMSSLQDRLGRLAVTIQGPSPGLPHTAVSQRRDSPQRELAPSPQKHLEALPSTD